MYRGPIELIVTPIHMQMEDDCMKAVQSYGFNVDKEELVKALNYDRNQYNAGYEDGHNNAIDEAMAAAANAICIGCGYLEGIECTYKGSNCGVSKPMLESVMKALERMKGGSHDQDM